MAITAILEAQIVGIVEVEVIVVEVVMNEVEEEEEGIMVKMADHETIPTIDQVVLKVAQDGVVKVILMLMEVLKDLKAIVVGEIILVGDK